MFVAPVRTRRQRTAKRLLAGAGGVAVSTNCSQQAVTNALLTRAYRSMAGVASALVSLGGIVVLTEILIDSAPERTWPITSAVAFSVIFSTLLTV